MTQRTRKNQVSNCMNIMIFDNLKVNKLHGIRNMIKLIVFGDIIIFVNRKLKEKHQVNKAMPHSIHPSLAR